MSNTLTTLDRFPQSDVRLRRALQNLEVKIGALGGLGITAGGISVVAQSPLFVNGSGVGLHYGAGLSVVAGALTATAGTTLAGLTDVLISSPTNGQVLTYNTVAMKWENATPTSGSTTLASLTDVLLSSPTNGQVLTYNTGVGKWENATPASGGGTVTAVTGTSPVISSGSSTTPAISLAGLTGLGTASYLVAMNAGGTGWTYVNPTSVGNVGTVTSVTGTAPINVATGTSTPVVSIGGLTGLGTANYVVAMNAGGTGWTYVNPSSFGGGGSIASYGQMYVNNGSTTMTISVTGTYVRVSGGMTAGTLSGVTFQNARELVVPNTGKYFIQWNMSLSCATAGAQPAGTIMLNGTANTTCTAQSSTAFSNTGSQVSGSIILSLSASDVIALAVTNDGGTQSIKVLNASLSILQIG